jgi:hypothetical protein
VTVARTPAPARAMSSVRNFEVKGTRPMPPVRCPWRGTLTIRHAAGREFRLLMMNLLQQRTWLLAHNPFIICAFKLTYRY